MESALEAQIGDLLKRCFGPSVDVTRVTALAGDASTRRYARVSLRGGGAPNSVVVMILADLGVAMSSEELAVFDEPPDELPYVNVHRFLASVGVAVPETYLDASRNGFLILEDVGDVTLWEAVQSRPEERVAELYQAAIDQLLLLQIDGTARADKTCVAFRQAFDARLFEWEFEHFIEYGLAERAHQAVSEKDLALMREHFAALSRFLDCRPRVLNHRDFHSWNLFVHNGRIRVIDFQDALLAPATYDLATLLGDRDTPAVITPGIERRLLAYYRHRWEAAGGPPWDPDDLWNEYATCALQKAFKVVGRFHFLARKKGKAEYLRYIPPTLRRLARLLERRDDLKPLRKVLARYLPEVAA